MVYKSDKFRFLLNKYIYDLIKYFVWIKFVIEKLNMVIVFLRNFSLVFVEEDGSCFQRIIFFIIVNNEGFFRFFNGFFILCKVVDVFKVWYGIMLFLE